MGLLSKAATNPSPPALDEMGAVLCSRLLSLGPGSTRAETAMTLLKAYGSFSAGLCLVLKEGSYVLYASVGAGTGAAGFSQEGLSPLQGKTYYSVDYTISGDFDPSPLRFWAFPLVPVQDRYPQAILMVGENQDSFSGETIEAVLEKAGEVFLPPEDAGNVSEAKLPEVELHPTDSFEATPFTMEGLDENSFDIEAELTKARKKPGPFDMPAFSRGGLLSRITNSRSLQEQEKTVPPAPIEKAVTDILSVCHEKFGAFRGLIIEALRYSADEFTGRIETMVSTFALVQEIALGRYLILFDRVRDEELIARHLIKTVPGKNIFAFEAEDSQEALALLKPYL